MHLPPIVALWLTLAFILFLFWREKREKTGVSRALWIPLIWLLITGSRFVSQWLTLGSTSGGSMEEGSPLDAVVFGTLILAGFHVLQKRNIKLSVFARNNPWLIAFFVYTLISIFWSEFPFIAFRRWIKILGHPIMVLVILTDPQPLEAVKRLLKRLAYVLVPLSICFIKYFPQFGRGFDSWTGQAYNTGVTMNKNELGYLCLVFGMFFFWNTLHILKMRKGRARRKELMLNVGFFALNYWLLMEASSATSLLTMLIGIGIIWFVGLPFVNRQQVGWYIAGAVVVFAALEPFLGIYEHVVKGVGRNLTLTDRTDVWNAVLGLQASPIFGTGFESFWLGNRLDTMWAKFPFHPTEAHNGYIEMYLNLGWVGVALLIGQFLGTFMKIQRDLVSRFEFARLRLGFLLSIVLYNYTEAAFQSVSFVWTMFFLIAVDYPLVRRRVWRSVRTRPEPKLVISEVDSTCLRPAPCE